MDNGEVGMKRTTAKEIIAFWLYMIRKESELDGYGSAETDQHGAENIIKFFEDMKDGKSTRNWQWEKTYEDYKAFQSLVDEIKEAT